MEPRIALRPHYNKRERFRGTFLKFGIKSGYKGRLNQTLLLIDIIDIEKPAEILTNHLWFNVTEEFKQLNLRSGDIVEFNARVKLYEKGYSDDDEDNPKRLDYHLTYPRKIEKCGHTAGDYSSYDSYNDDIIQKVLDHEAHRREQIDQWIEQKNNPQPKTTPKTGSLSSEKADLKKQRNAELTEFL
jgi:hypothetical protein